MPDLEWILRDSDFWLRPVSAKTLQSFTPSGEYDLEVSSLRDLMLPIMQDILHEPIMLETVSQRLKQKASAQPICLTSIGPCRATSHLESSLSPRKVSRFGAGILISDTPIQYQAAVSDSIAVIGITGKFPEAEDLDELWDIMVQGRDLHSLVDGLS